MMKIGNGKRGVALMTAVFLAVAGGVLMFAYIRGLEGKALADTSPLVVLVAKDKIPAGTTAEKASASGLIEQKTLPKVAVLDGAVSSLTAIAGKSAAVDILKGEQIVAARFAAPGEGRGILSIPEGHQAMSVDVALPPAVAGFIQAGDHVSIIAKTSRPKPKTQFVLQNIAVLQIGQHTADGKAASAKSSYSSTGEHRMYTLSVTPQEAEKLAYALLEGSVYFTLLPPGQAASETPGRTEDNLFSKS
jgi:pilus assembly protein CpaB